MSKNANLRLQLCQPSIPFVEGKRTCFSNLIFKDVGNLCLSRHFINTFRKNNKIKFFNGLRWTVIWCNNNNICNNNNDVNMHFIEGEHLAVLQIQDNNITLLVLYSSSTLRRRTPHICGHLGWFKCILGPLHDRISKWNQHSWIQN